jgi:hypothetical protein
MELTIEQSSVIAVLYVPAPAAPPAAGPEVSAPAVPLVDAVVSGEVVVVVPDPVVPVLVEAVVSVEVPPLVVVSEAVVSVGGVAVVPVPVVVEAVLVDTPAQSCFTCACCSALSVDQLDLISS